MSYKFAWPVLILNFYEDCFNRLLRIRLNPNSNPESYTVMFLDPGYNSPGPHSCFFLFIKHFKGLNLMSSSMGDGMLGGGGVRVSGRAAACPSLSHLA